MHCTGSLVLRGERFEVDCHPPRDRSWRQLRTEAQGGHPMPPVAWTPVSFGDDFSFNQVGFEAVDSDPIWAGVFDVPEGTPSHHFAWVLRDGELRDVTEVRRSVSEYHPELFAPVKQEIVARDEDGRTYRLRGEALAMAAIPTWPNAVGFDSVVRWEDDEGRVGHGPCQGLWYDAYQRAMKARRGD
jgi:hypothetical protein